MRPKSIKYKMRRDYSVFLARKAIRPTTVCWEYIYIAIPNRFQKRKCIFNLEDSRSRKY